MILPLRPGRNLAGAAFPGGPSPRRVPFKEACISNKRFHKISQEVLLVAGFGADSRTAGLLRDAAPTAVHEPPVLLRPKPVPARYELTSSITIAFYHSDFLPQQERVFDHSERGADCYIEG